MREMRRRAPASARSAGKAKGAWQARAFAALLALAANAASGEVQAPIVHRVQGLQAELPKVSVASTLSVHPATRAAIGVTVGPAGALPKNAFVRVRGLPPAVSLSEGYAIAPGAWAVPLHAPPSLQMLVPAGVTGRADVVVALVSEEGAQLAEARTVLVIEASAPPAPDLATKGELKAPAPSPRPAILSPGDREAAEKFVARGERELEQGQIAIARQFFLRAAQVGYAPGALLMAATYDPRELARWRAQGVQPNLDEARKWYQRARELGAPEAEERLARLGAG